MSAAIDSDNVQSYVNGSWNRRDTSRSLEESFPAEVMRSVGSDGIGDISVTTF